MKRKIDFLTNIYLKYILKRDKEAPFLSFLFFLLTIFTSRLTVMWVEAGRPLLKFFMVYDYHIHHFYLGIFLLILSNWLSSVRNKNEWMREIRILNSILFGVGLGFITDEFSLLLTMEFDVKGEYWAPHSYYLMALLSGIFASILLFKRKKEQ